MPILCQACHPAKAHAVHIKQMSNGGTLAYCDYHFRESGQQIQLIKSHARSNSIENMIDQSRDGSIFSVPDVIIEEIKANAKNRSQKEIREDCPPSLPNMDWKRGVESGSWNLMRRQPKEHQSRYAGTLTADIWQMIKQEAYKSEPADSNQRSVELNRRSGSGTFLPDFDNLRWEANKARGGYEAWHRPPGARKREEQTYLFYLGKRKLQELENDANRTTEIQRMIAEAREKKGITQ